jgi:hypothetical protein
MDAKAMNPLPFLSSAVVTQTLLAVGIGMLIGWMHFRTLKWNTDLLVRGGRLWRPVLLVLARMLVTAAALYFCVRHGVTLPAVLVGLLIARSIVLRKARTK